LHTAKGAGRRDSSSAVEEKPTFSPQITKRAKSIERSRTISSTDRLYAQAQASKEKQEQLRESIMQLESANNTFKPTLHSAKPDEEGAQDVKKPSKPISERMKQYIEERNRKLEEAKRLAEAKAAAENTFRPQIQTSRPHTPTSARTESVFERLTKTAPKPAARSEEPPKRPVSVR
jgi:gas vesicle protein